MKQILKLVFLLVIGQTAFAQAPSNYTNINGRYRWIAGMFDSTFHIPKGSTPSLRTGGSTNSGGLFYNTSDSSVYTYTGTQWIKLRGSINPSDTTNKYVTQVYKKSGSDSIFYVKGGVHTWAFNDSTGSPGGGGGGKVYYFNGGVSMGTIGGLQMYELGDTANTGAAANFTRATTGNIANFITDPGKPGLLQIPAGVWSVDAWLSETGGGANHAEIWIEVEKWDGSTITTIATSPIEQITEGATPNLYSWSVTIPTTSLTITDRIIIQFYISNTNGKTVTLYTQNGYVGEVHTTFTTGIGAINGLTAPAQYLVTGTSGTDFNINSSTATHTFNLPTASATNRGALSTTDWTTFNSKIGPSDTASMLSPYLRKADTTAMLNPYFRLAGVGLKNTGQTVYADTLLLSTRAWRQKGIDSVASLITGGYVPNSRTITINGTSQDLSANRTYNVGTVTSVATSSATGITGGTFTTSGTIAADTLLLSTRLWRQKGIDSVAALPRVTSVATNTGTGITGGTITTSGTIAADTLLLSTRAWRQKGIDSVQSNITSGLALKLNISDTATMLANYINSVGFGLSKTGQSARVDTSTLATSFLRRKDSLTATNLLGYVTRKILADTAAAIRSAGGTGTVTSVATNTGTGITGGTITTSGTLAIDTLLISTRAWRQKGVDSLQANINTKQNTLTLTTTGTSGAATLVGATLNIPQYQSALTNPVTGTGTTNYIPKFTGSSAIGNSNLINDASGNLGLGVTPSAWQTDVKAIQIGDAGSNISANNAAYSGGNNVWINSNSFQNSSVQDIYIRTATAGQYQIQGNAHIWRIAPSGTAGNAISFTQAMTLDASGRLGIGTTSISNTLDIQAAQATLRLTSSTGTNTVYSQFSNTSGNFYIGKDNSTGSAFGVANGTLLYESGANPMVFFTNSAQRMRITSAGNVAIGNTTGSEKLHVTGNVLASGYFNSNDGTRNVYLNPGADFGAGALPTIQVASNHALQFATNNTLRMTLTAAGELLIATTTDAGNYKLQVNGAIYSTNGTSENIWMNDGTSSSSLQQASNIFYINGNASSATHASIVFRSSSAYTERMRINSTGELLIATTTDAGNYKLQVSGDVYATAYFESSDLRLKNVLSERQGSDGINTINFKWKDGRDNLTHIGYAAQQVEKVLPDAVKTNPDGYKTVNYDEVQTLKIANLEQEVKELKALINKLMDKK